MGLKPRLLLGALSLSLLVSCHRTDDADGSPQPAQQAHKVDSHQFIKSAMGTPFKVTLVGHSFPQARQLARLAFQELERIERRVSSWRAQSEIGVLNRAKGEWSPLSAETHWLLSRAHDLNALTRASFDVTWAALKGVWDFRAKRLPDPALVSARLKLIGAHHLSLRGGSRPPLAPPPSPLWMRRLAPDHPLRAELSLESTEQSASAEGGERYMARLTLGAEVDLGGIAKGYALDSMARLLRRYGAGRFLIDGGGDLLAYGESPQGTEWGVGVRHPRRDELLLTLKIPSGWSVVTSGDYERYFILGGERYHHIIDLRSGYPAQGTASVTLFAREALMADALATGMMVLGAQEGLEVIEGLEGAEAMWMSVSGDVTYSSGFKRFSEALPARWGETSTDPHPNAEPQVGPTAQPTAQPKAEKTAQ